MLEISLTAIASWEILPRDVGCMLSSMSCLHLIRKPIYAPPGVAVDNGLRDRERLVEVAQGVQLPLLAVHCDVELLDT